MVNSVPVIKQPPICNGRPKGHQALKKAHREARVCRVTGVALQILMVEKKLWLREYVRTGRSGTLAGLAKQHLVRTKGDTPGTAHPLSNASKPACVGLMLGA